MEPTLDVGQRVLVNRLSHRLGRRPQGRRHHHLPPAGGGRRDAAALRRPAGRQPAVPGADARAVQADLHQAGRRGGWRPHRGARRARRPQRQAPERDVHRLVRRRAGLRPAARDHRPAGLRLLHGRQPRRVRRRPLLGADPDRLGHRRGRSRRTGRRSASARSSGARCISGQPAALLRGMAAGSTRISGRTWRRVGGLAAVGLVIAALGSGHSGSSEGTSPGPSSYPTPVGVPGDTSVRSRGGARAPAAGRPGSAGRLAAELRRGHEHRQLAHAVAPPLGSGAMRAFNLHTRRLRVPRRQPPGLPPGPRARGGGDRLEPDRRHRLRAAARRERLALPLRAGRRGVDDRPRRPRRGAHARGGAGARRPATSSASSRAPTARTRWSTAPPRRPTSSCSRRAAGRPSPSIPTARRSESSATTRARGSWPAARATSTTGTGRLGSSPATAAPFPR